MLYRNFSLLFISFLLQTSCSSGNGSADAEADTLAPDADTGDARDSSPDTSAPDADASDGDSERDTDVGHDGHVEADVDETQDADLDWDVSHDWDADQDWDADGPPPLYAECFSHILEGGSDIMDLDYDQFSPILAPHCMGTNHQDIQGIERVVFLGDSVTVGSPPTLGTQAYRSVLADKLAERFDLTPPGPLWRTYDPINGTSLVRTAGDFSCCAEWGARTDDILQGDAQIPNCFPENERQKKTLVIMTYGGNDVAHLTKNYVEGNHTHEELWEQIQGVVDYLDEGVRWFYEDPNRFPNGVYVVFGNMFEFTDGTGNTTACPAAALAGFTSDVEDPGTLADMLVWANEQFLNIAVTYNADMIFMLERFCGHGWANDDPSSPCYNPGAPRWFDLSCTHPNPWGHNQLAYMFWNTVIY